MTDLYEVSLQRINSLSSQGFCVVYLREVCGLSTLQSS